MQGEMLSVVFQSGHCVEPAAFPLPRHDTGRMEAPWAVHQIETTVDFGRRSRLLTWFIGGLNFQIEHHLFPRICHLHYLALAPIVEETCREFGLQYLAHETFRAAVASHFRWLRQMGTAGSVDEMGATLTVPLGVDETNDYRGTKRQIRKTTEEVGGLQADSGQGQNAAARAHSY